MGEVIAGRKRTGRFRTPIETSGHLPSCEKSVSVGRLPNTLVIAPRPGLDIELREPIGQDL